MEESESLENLQRGHLRVLESLVLELRRKGRVERAVWESLMLGCRLMSGG